MERPAIFVCPRGGSPDVNVRTWLHTAEIPSKCERPRARSEALALGGKLRSSLYWSSLQQNSDWQKADDWVFFKKHVFAASGRTDLDGETPTARYRSFCEELDLRASQNVERWLSNVEECFASHKAVNLAHLGLGDRGMLPILALLQNYRSLETLILTNNALTDVGIAYILAALTSHNKLCSLHMSGNVKITCRSTSALLMFLVDHPDIIEFSLEGSLMAEPKREVLYLQAFANRNYSLRDSTAELTQPGSAEEEPTPTSRVHARVEDMARRFQLCEGKLAKAPPVGLLFPCREEVDVCEYSKDLAMANMMFRRWQFEYSRCRASAARSPKNGGTSRKR